MSHSIVQTRGAVGSAITSLSVTFGSATAGNNTLYVTARSSPGPTFTSLTDNKAGGSNSYTLGEDILNPSSLRTAYWYATDAGAAAHQVTVAVSGSSTLQIIIAEISGLETSSVLEVDGSNQVDAQSTWPLPDLTTAVASTLLVTSIAAASDVTYTPPSNYTAFSGTGVPTTRMSVAAREVSATGTYGGSWGISPAASITIVHAAFKVAAAAGGDLTATHLATGLATIGQATLAQNHNLTVSALTTGLSTIGTPTLVSPPTESFPQTIATSVFPYASGTDENTHIAGPFKASTGALYAFSRDATTDTSLSARKTTTPGFPNAWAVPSGGTLAGGTGRLLALSGYQVGDVVHLALMFAHSSSAVISVLKYVTYNMATETFGTLETVESSIDPGTLSTITGTRTTYRESCLVVRSTGEVVLTYCGPAEPDSAALDDITRIYLATRAAGGGWTLRGRVSGISPVANPDHFPALGLDDNDIVHIFTNGHDVHHRALSAANVLQTETTSTAAANGSQVRAVSYLSGGVRKVAAVVGSDTAGNALFTSFTSSLGVTPSWSNKAFTNIGAPRVLFADDDDLYVLFRDTTNQDLYRSSSTDDGSTWSARVLQYTGSVVASGPTLTQWHPSYVRTGTYRIGYFTADSALGAWIFDEYDTTRAAVTLHALTANGLTTGLSTLGTATISQTHALTATGVTTGLGTVGTSTIAQKHTLTATAVSTLLTTIGTSAISQLHGLTASALATGLTAIDLAALSQLHGLLATALQTALATIQLAAILDVQEQVPVGDVSIGDWTDQDLLTSALYDAIDEDPGDYVEFIRSRDLSPGETDTYEVLLAAAGDAPLTAGHVIEYGYRKRGDATVNLTVSLRQGTSTEIAAWVHNGITEAEIDAAQPLTEGQAGNIANYSDLRLRFVAEAV